MVEGAAEAVEAFAARPHPHPPCLPGSLPRGLHRHLRLYPQEPWTLMSSLPTGAAAAGEAGVAGAGGRSAGSHGP